MKTIGIAVSVNGITRQMQVEPRLTLADLLREHLGLTGCKVACDAGVCGACTVLLDGAPVAACSTFAFETDQCSVLSIEGLGANGELDPLQKIFMEEQAFQCGYCTSGMVLATKAFLAANPAPDDKAICDALSGNLCRCTGYRMIVDAVRRAASEIPVNPVDEVPR